jgi:hypothetical protein
VRKLQFYGIGGKFHDLIASRLSNRYQRVLITSADLSYIGISHWDTFRQGVPQGTIPGVLLFLFYINDLSTIFNNSVQSVFADDTSFIISSNNIYNTEMKSIVPSLI